MRSEVSDYILDNIRQTLKGVPDQAVNEFIDSILAARKVFIYGVGRSGLTGKMFAVRLVQMGLDVHFVGDMTTPIVGEEDLSIIISHTGETMSIVQTANISRRMGCKVVGITSDENSKLSHASNTVVLMQVPHNGEKVVLAPLGTLFEDAVILFFDSIVPLLMAKLEENECNMRQRHAIWV
ncbi:MAG: SIS domain-containing protein [Candidatus Methanomethylophilaceae archaeon]|nr:SIS domain-containing protein [Candidatus Methanomethylophilaceae archaeon]